MKLEPNALYYGDCLDVLAQWPAGKFDLVYLDPPFNSKAQYNVLFGKAGAGDRAQIMAFDDTWRWDEAAAERVDRVANAEAHPARAAITGLHEILGECGMLGYLAYMADRLKHIRRVMKESASVYLHCDPTASHYLKIIMDAVFGQANFRNEIIWSYQRWTGATKHFQRMHDVILFYGASPDTTFHRLKEGYSAKSKHKGARVSVLANGGKLEQTYTGDTSRKKDMRDVWEISYLNSQARERLGYPTQKPEALLDRVIEASSNEGDLVLDPFCGCGTTVAVAKRKKRRWVGIDISPFAIDTVKNRRLGERAIPVHGVPVDYETAKVMARQSPFDFEKWAVTRVPGVVPNVKQVADGGVDGRGRVHGVPKKGGLVLAQVKGGKFHLSQLRDFTSVVENANAMFGVFITLDKVTSRQARAWARQQGTVRFGAHTYPKVQLWSIEEHFDGRDAKVPTLRDPYTGEKLNTDLFGYRQSEAA